METLTEMPKASLFCEILNSARVHKFPGYWEGSAFRDHPCGIIKETIKLTNNWSTYDYCSVQITDGSGWSDDYCRKSCAHGNPHPKPIDGTAICVWRNGDWVNDEFKERLEPIILNILNQSIEHRILIAQKNKEEHERKMQKSKEEADLIIKAALLKFS